MAQSICNLASSCTYVCNMNIVWCVRYYVQFKLISELYEIAI